MSEAASTERKSPVGMAESPRGSAGEGHDGQDTWICMNCHTSGNDAQASRRGGGNCPKCGCRTRPYGRRPRQTSTDCRTPEGVAVGLVDGILATARVLATADLSSAAVREALADLRADESLSALLTTERGSMDGEADGAVHGEREGAVSLMPQDVEHTSSCANADGIAAEVREWLASSAEEEAGRCDSSARIARAAIIVTNNRADVQIPEDLRSQYLSTHEKTRDGAVRRSAELLRAAAALRAGAVQPAPLFDPQEAAQVEHMPGYYLCFLACDLVDAGGADPRLVEAVRQFREAARREEQEDDVIGDRPPFGAVGLTY
jgi:hypothetical protein